MEWGPEDEDPVRFILRSHPWQAEDEEGTSGPRMRDRLKPVFKNSDEERVKPEGAEDPLVKTIILSWPRIISKPFSVYFQMSMLLTLQQATLETDFT